MKIRVTEIEASADDLRQSKSLAEAMSNAMRNAFNGINSIVFTTECDDEEEEQEA